MHRLRNLVTGTWQGKRPDHTLSNANGSGESDNRGRSEPRVAANEPGILNGTVCPSPSWPRQLPSPSMAQTLSRHARPCAGHPRLGVRAKPKTWMAGTSHRPKSVEL